MSDQRLRLLAELKDNMSGGLKAINKELKETRRTPGMEQVQTWFTGFNETAGQFVKTGGVVSDVFGRMGVGGLAAAAGLGGLVEQFKALGDHTFAMKRLGQETKMTIDQVARWEYVGKVFHVPVQAVDAALKHFGDSMVNFMRRRGEIWGQLNQQDPAEADKLLGIKDPNARFQEIINFLGTIKDVATREAWARMFFGSDEIEAVLTDGMPKFNKAIQDAGQNVHTLTDAQQKQYADLNDSLAAFDTAWDNLKLAAAPTVFKGLTEITDDLKAAFEDLKPLVDWLQQEATKTSSEIVSDVTHAAQKAVADAVTEAKRAAADAVSKGVDQVKENSRPAPGRAGFGEDGNALHKNDETSWPAPAPRRAPPPMPTAPPPAPSPLGVLKRPDFGASNSPFGALQRPDFAPPTRLFGGKLEKSAFTTFDDAGGGFGAGGKAGEDALADGVKEGVLAAFREWAQEQQAAAAGKGGGSGGFTKASFGGGGLRGSFDRDTPAGAGESIAGDLKARGLAAMRYLIGKKGWTPEGAAIAVGNAQQESAIRGNGPAGDGGMSQHMFQWNHERLAALRAFAAKRGKSPGDFETNLDFMDEERKHRSGLEREWNKQHDLRNAGRLSHLYEGFGDNSTATREQNARNWLRAFQESGGQTPNLADEARKAAGGGGKADGTIDAHIHVHQDGHVRRATAKGSGSVKPPGVTIRRGPTMTQPDYTA